MNATPLDFIRVGSAPDCAKCHGSGEVDDGLCPRCWPPTAFANEPSTAEVIRSTSKAVQDGPAIGRRWVDVNRDHENAA